MAILPRGVNPFFSDLLEAVARFNPEEILIINSRPIKELAVAHKEIWIKEQLSAGELVNIAIEEAKTPFVFVLWDDMIFNAEDVSHHLFLKLEERGDLCAVPQFYNSHGGAIPSLSLPIFPPNDIFRVIRTNAQTVKDSKTFMTLDYCGVYNRARFLNLGGYDTQLTSNYWQKVEFGMRAAMWGERIVLNHALSLTYAEAPPVDDESVTLCTTLFALKTLGVKMSAKGAYLPWMRIFWLWPEHRAMRLFKEVQKWVEENRFRFKSDAVLIVDSWQSYQSDRG